MRSLFRRCLLLGMALLAMLVKLTFYQIQPRIHMRSLHARPLLWAGRAAVRGGRRMTLHALLGGVRARMPRERMHTREY